MCSCSFGPNTLLSLVASKGIEHTALAINPLSGTLDRSLPTLGLWLPSCEERWLNPTPSCAGILLFPHRSEVG